MDTIMTPCNRAERRKLEAWERSSNRSKQWVFIAEYGVGNEVTEVEFSFSCATKDAAMAVSQKVTELIREDYGVDRDGADWVTVKKFQAL